jgi:hypothetical protein
MANVPAAPQNRTTIPGSLPGHECASLGENGRAPAPVRRRPPDTMDGLVGNLGGRLHCLSFRHQHPYDVLAGALFPTVFTRGKYVSLGNDSFDRMTAIANRTINPGYVADLTSDPTHNNLLLIDSSSIFWILHCFAIIRPISQVTLSSFMSQFRTRRLGLLAIGLLSIVQRQLSILSNSAVESRLGTLGCPHRNATNHSSRLCTLAPSR